MLPFPVLEYLDVLEAHGSHFCACFISQSMHSLALEAVEPTFGWGITPAITFTAHRADHAVFLELFLKFFADILIAADALLSVKW